MSQTTATRGDARPPKSAAAARARRSKRPSWMWMLVLALIVLVGGVTVFAAGGGSGSSTTGEGSTGPLLASTGSNADGKTVDGIQCLGAEQLLFHDHSHLSVFVDGEQRTVPAFIGFAPDGSCLYWLHSHTPDGVIHMESPRSATFTLGNYFDIWGQPLSSTQVGPATGTVTTFVDGEALHRRPARHSARRARNVQLDVGKVVPFKSYKYGEGL